MVCNDCSGKRRSGGGEESLGWEAGKGRIIESVLFLALVRKLIHNYKKGGTYGQVKGTDGFFA